jgi:hypothetical protein
MRILLGGSIDRVSLHHSSKYELDWVDGEGDPQGLSSAAIEERECKKRDELAEEEDTT